MKQIFRHISVRSIATTLAAITLLVAFVVPRYAVAAEYSCNTYGSGDYNNSEECSTTGGSSGGSSGGGTLSNTGQALAIIIPAGMIIAGSLTLFYLHRKKDHPPIQGK